MSTLLQLSDLLVCRDGHRVLKIESPSVERGDVLAVVGPNGAGKSTLFLALARLLKAERGQTALVLQEPLLMDMSVYENTAPGLKFRKRSRAEIADRVTRWLRRLDAAHLSGRPVTSYKIVSSRRIQFPTGIEYGINLAGGNSLSIIVGFNPGSDAAYG